MEVTKCKGSTKGVKEMNPTQILRKLAEEHGFKYIPPVSGGRTEAAGARVVNYETRRVVSFHWGVPGWIGWRLQDPPHVIREEELFGFLMAKE